MIASYYFWKWADNDLPGQPVEVHAALLRGALHPALQTFDARPLLARLGEYAAARHAQGRAGTGRCIRPARRKTRDLCL